MSSNDSIYQAPGSSLERPVSGDERPLEEILDGNFEFEIGDILREAMALLKGSKTVVLGTLLITLAISGATNAAGAALGSIDDSGALSVLVTLAGTAITYPINAGLYLFTIKRAAGDESASFDDVFSCFSFFWPILGLSILQIIAIGLGLLAFVIPGIYLAVAYALALPVLVTRHLGIWESLEASRKALGHCWFRVFGMMMAVGFIVIAGAGLTLGIGLIWLIPFATLCYGVSFYKIFGYTPTAA